MSASSLRRTALNVRAAGFCCSLLSLVPCAVAAADEQEVQLETIVITADPFSRTADRLTQPTEIIGGEELERRRAATLGETLEHAPGVSTTDFGRGAGRPVIRGQGGPRVLMLENGLGTTDASDVSPDHDVGVDAAHAEQIEILKGPATLLYGSGASAGVVNVVDGRLPDAWEEGAAAQLRSAYGLNADERSVAGRASYGLRGGMQLGLDGAWRDAGDYDGEDGRRVRNSDVEKKSGAVSAARFWGERGSIAASAGRYETTYGLPVEERAFIDLEQDRFDLEARLREPVAGWESVALRAALGDYEHTEFEAPGEPGTIFRNDQSELRVEAVHAPFAGLTGVIGVQRRGRDFRAIGEEAFTPSTDSRSLGVFLLERAPTAFGSVELGVRLDRDHHDPRDVLRAERRFAPVSFSGGALFELSERYHIKLYATRAERAPAVEELYAFGPHLATASFERGDADARTERAHNLEVVLDRHGDALSWRVNLFAQRTADFLHAREVDAGLNADGSGAGASDGIADRVDESGAFDPEGELLLLDYTAGDARFWGGEGEVSYAWRRGPTRWRARVFGDLVRGRLDDGGGDLPRMTPPRLGAGLHARRGPWGASIDFTRVMRQSRTAALETRTDGYGLLSADLDWTVPAPGGSLTLFLRGRNLLDEDARRHTSFIKAVSPLPGLNVVAGMEWRMD